MRLERRIKGIGCGRNGSVGTMRAYSNSGNPEVEHYTLPVCGTEERWQPPCFVSNSHNSAVQKRFCFTPVRSQPHYQPSVAVE